MGSKPSFFNKHPTLSIVLVNVALVLLLVLALEMVLRFTVEYSIGYYTGTSKPGVVEYPYGEIVINSEGYADEEFDYSSPKPRIGYFGDSVTYGVGAGYPYRVSEYVEQRYPEYQHWNLSGNVGGDLSEKEMLRVSRKYDLDYVVYLLNLNDIFPIKTRGDAAQSTLQTLKRFVNKYLDVLRSRSYLYSYLRTKAKTVLQKAGFEATGYRAYELWPHENEWVFEEFTNRLNETYRTLRSEGRQMCVILLPYEMQISSDAASAYRDMGFQWEDGFEFGSSQRLLQKLTNGPIVFDPIPAFDRDSAQLGEYFVYNKGDKIDWNHPNREGHRVIAESFMASSGCPFLNPANPGAADKENSATVQPGLQGPGGTE